MCNLKVKQSLFILQMWMDYEQRVILCVLWGSGFPLISWKELGKSEKMLGQQPKNWDDRQPGCFCIPKTRLPTTQAKTCSFLHLAYNGDAKRR